MRGKLIAGKYELDALVGRGGMGTVWRATDRALQRLVAVKLMASRHRRSGSFRERFESEARALASLHNPHVVQVYDYGVEDETPYIVMELLDGESLEARLERDAPMSPKAVLELVRQITSGLAAAAAARTVHRDLKPENVFIVSEAQGETVKLLDFGLAWMRSTQTLDPSGGKIVGTPAFMSPEGLRGHTPGLSHDLWSLAVLVYKALTAQLPFTGRTLGKLIVNVCTSPVPPASTHVASLGPSLDAFFVRALDKDPSRRFRSAAELLDAFAEACRSVESTKILAVDDEPDMCELLELRFRREIRSRQYEFVFADNGVRALEQLRRHPDVDVILADINMPEMDGLTLLGKLPELAPHARTIMVSAYSDMANIRQAMNSGAFDFVVKPIDFKDLDATIKKTARVAREQRELAASERENRLLRRLLPAAASERVRSLGAAGLSANDTQTGTAVYLRLPGGQLAFEGEQPTPDSLRELNARFELLLPELERAGGELDALRPHAALVHFVGRGHAMRALSGCRNLMRELDTLAALAGPESPYARGLAIGLCSGPLVSACIGSQVGGCLRFAMIGPTVESARALAHVATPGQVLAPATIGAADGLCSSFHPAEGPAAALDAHAFDWARPLPPPPTTDEPEDTLSIDGLAQIEDAASELGLLALGWTMSEG